MTKLETLKSELLLAEGLVEQAEYIYLYEDSCQEFEDNLYDACDILDRAIVAMQAELNKQRETTND